MIAIYAALLGIPLVVLVADMLVTFGTTTRPRQTARRQVPTRLNDR
jgi:hypothetical protein